MNTSLTNGHIVVEIEPTHGCIVRLEHPGLGIDLVKEPRLAENFRLLVPLPTWRGHYIWGNQQPLADIQVADTCCTLTWRDLHSSEGTFDIEVVQTIALNGDDLTFQMSVTNRSPYEVEEAFNFALGGMANHDERNDWHLHYANHVGKGMEWDFYDTFPGSYLGPQFPVWSAMYHGDLSMPWIDLYNDRARKGVYIGNHDLEARQSVCWAQLIPCTSYRGPEGNAQYWPEPAITGDTPVGLTLAWNSFPFLESQDTWNGPPIVFHFHEGIWWAAADYFRSWFDSHTTVDKRGSWMVEEDAWQSTIISYPEGTIGYRFTDLPRMAADAKQYGIRVLQIDGWDIGGIDRDYPRYTPDPRLGTWDDLRDAIEACAAIGVRVMLFSNLQWINLETEWYAEELERYAVRDPHGHVRGGMGWEYNTTLGLQNQTIYRMVAANPSRPEYRQIILDQLRNVLRLGAPGTQIDKLGAMREFDYAPDNPAPHDAALFAGTLQTLSAFYDLAHETNAEFRIASEVHCDKAVPFVDASYSRFFSADHLPTFAHTFPEYRQSCCITGNWDFGLVNNCLRFGHIINVEGHCLHGTASDAPDLSRYVAEALRVRRQLWDDIWHSSVIEPPTGLVEAPTSLHYCLHQAWEGGGYALVLNHFEPGDVSATINPMDGMGSAIFYRPFAEPEAICLPATAVVPRDHFLIITFVSQDGAKAKEDKAAS